MRTRVGLFLLVGLGLTAGLAVPAARAQSSGTLLGSVTGAGGETVAHAVVQIVDLRRRVHTDPQGGFRFEDVPAGQYLVQATSARYGSGIVRVSVGEGETRLDIRLDVSVHQEAVVVTAQSDARALSDVAQPVSVLSGDELLLRTAPTLGETLASQPGVSSTYFGPGASRPVIRGLGGDRIRVLEDGVGVGDASNTSPDHAVSTEPFGATTIEVVRGPATLLYGSSAVGGVVNVIDDRIPDAAPEHVLAGTLDLLAASVSDEWSGGASVKAGAGPLVLHGGFVRRETEDLQIPGFAESEQLRAAEEGGGEGEEHEEAFGILPNSAIDSTSGSLGASYVGSKGFFGASWTAFDTLYGIPGGHAHEAGAGEGGEEGHAEEGGVRVDLRQRRFDVRGARAEPFGAFRGAKLRFGITDYEHQELEGDEVGTLFLNDAWEGRLEMLHKPLGAATGSFGVQLASRDFEAIGEEAFVPPTETRAFAGFVFEELGTGAWRGQLGARYEHQSVKALGDVDLERTFDAFSGSLGVLYRGGSGFGGGLTLALSQKVPNAEELYSNGPHIATGVFEIGDPDLAKEKSLGLDLSLSKRAGPVTGQLSGFVNRFDDYIYESFTGEEEDGLPVARYIQGDASFWGFEAAAAIELLHAEPRHLDLELSADYVRASLRGGDESPLPRIPPFRYGAALHYADNRLDGRVEVRGVAAQERVSEFELPTDGYTFLNASLGYRFFLGHTVLQLRLQGNNLTDEEGRNHVSFLKDVAPLPGRDFRAAVRLLF
jgi:iron complex outermembrane receptor protein